MERFSKDELFLIAIDLDIGSLVNFCQSSKYINSKVCNNNNFWVNKLKKDFDIEFFRKMIEMENYNNILNISMDYWINSEDNSYKVIKDMLDFFNDASKKE